MLYYNIYIKYICTPDKVEERLHNMHKTFILYLIAFSQFCALQQSQIQIF